MKRLLAVLFVALFVGCELAPTEVRTSKFKEITFQSRSDKSDTIMFEYLNGDKRTYEATKSQWLRILHARNLDGANRKNVNYTITYREKKLISFYKKD